VAVLGIYPEFATMWFGEFWTLLVLKIVREGVVNMAPRMNSGVWIIKVIIE
tara:strand:- start:290 stop:442 length:153 start_codon:yes stop_codon:yes gene_type:complete